MKKRDRRPITLSHASLMVGKSGKSQKDLFDFSCDAVPESTGSSSSEKVTAIDRAKGR